MSETQSEFRVSAWDDFIGQDDLKERLDVHIQSALNRQADRLEHIFLYGPPGMGKTTLAGVIANRFLRPLHKFVMPLDDRALRRVVNDLWGVVLFDELHRCSTKQQEQLLSLLEDGYLTTKNGRVIENPLLTIVGATTERSEVIKPLLDRFPVRPEFVPYTDGELTQIAQGMLKTAGLSVDAEFAEALARACGGVPRNIASLVTMARDLHAVNGDVAPEDVLEYCGLTEDGLTAQHVKYLETLHTNGGPMGLSTIATVMHLGASSVRELEQFFVQRGWLEYSPSGRDLTLEGARRVREMKMKEDKSA